MGTPTGTRREGATHGPHDPRPSHPGWRDAGSVVASGPWGKVVWARTASGKSPARDFFDALPDPQAAKVQALFNRMAETGKIHNRQKFKKLRDIGGQALWEFKSSQIRFLGRLGPGPTFIVASGLRKKRGALVPRDLKRAARILDEHDEAQWRVSGGAPNGR